MLAYSLHTRLHSDEFDLSDYYIAFSLHDLMDVLSNHASRAASETWLEESKRLLKIGYYTAARDQLLRPQGFIPGYQYLLQSSFALGTATGTVISVLCTAVAPKSCCKEKACEHGTVTGITCEKHGDFDFSAKCLQGECRPKDWRL
jgi:hypothetical protein